MLSIEPLGINKLPITVMIKHLGEISENHQLVMVKGGGWSMSGGSKGNLKIMASYTKVD